MKRAIASILIMALFSSMVLLSSCGKKDEESTASPNGSGDLIGNKNTKKVHYSSCSYLPDQQNRVYFSSCSEAKGAGYVGCQQCGACR